MRANKGFTLLLCGLLASCCAGAGSNHYIELVGGAPTEVAGGGADDPQVVTALADLVEGRAYGPGTYINYGGCTGPHDESKIIPGPTYSYIAAGERVTGTGVRQSGRYIITMPLAEGTLTLDSDYNRAQ